MKNKILYILFILAFFGLTYLLNMGKKPEFTWIPTYSKYDKQPFGAFVLDKMLDASLKQTYTHSYKSVYRLLNEEYLENQNLLILTNSFDLPEEDIKDLLAYVEKGNKVLIAASYFSYDLMDTLHLSYNRSGYLGNIVDPLNIRKSMKPVYFFRTENQITSYEFPYVTMDGYFDPFIPAEATALNDSVPMEDKQSEDIRESDLSGGVSGPDSVVREDLPPVTVLAEDEFERPLLLKYPVGKGYLLLSSTPKMFTNYGVLDSVNSGFVWQTMGYLQDQPLMRTENLQRGTDQSTSPLRYILSNRALRWGLYVALLTVVLFMIFTAKRKQKVIPVIKAPENKMLSFVRSIASLYLRKNNNADMVRKKYVYWADRMKQQYGVDLINSEHDREFCISFAAKTGRDPDQIIELLGRLDSIHPDNYVTDEEMKQLIEKMNLIK